MTLQPITINFEIDQKQIQQEGEFLIVKGTATTNSRDDQGYEILITPNAFKEYLAKNKVIENDVQHAYFRDIRGQTLAPIQRPFDESKGDKWVMPEFADRIVGTVIELDYTPKDLDMNTVTPTTIPQTRVEATSKVIDKLAIEYIQNGKLTGFSMLWTGTAMINEKLKIKWYTEIEDVLLTFTPSPRNPDCNDIEVVKETDKLENKEIKETEFKASQKISFDIPDFEFKAKEKVGFEFSFECKANEYTKGGITFEGYNKPKMTPDHLTKKAAVLAKLGNRIKLIRFGAQGYGSNYSLEARKQYKQRHAKDINGSVMTAGYWANKFLWSPSSPVIQPPKK